MNIPNLSTTEVVLIATFVAAVAACIVAFLLQRKRRTRRLRAQFGGAEYARTVGKDGSRRTAEAALEQRTQRVESFHVQPLSPGDHTRFVESWRGIQGRFVDGPAGAVTEADQLLGDVMSTRGYPVSDFEQRAADISVDHPLVLANYRSAHAIALKQTQGQATTEDLRIAMVHFRTLFEELISEPAIHLAKAAV